MKNLGSLLALCVLWSGLPILPVAQAAVPCKQWGTGKFFRRATPNDVRACVAQGSDVDLLQKNGLRPIHRAAEYTKDPEVLGALVGAGADPNVRNKYGRTPLHIVSTANLNKAARPGLIRALLATGADPNAQDAEGLTPLHAMFLYRFNSPRLETAQALLEAGADPNLLTHEGTAVLDWVGKAEIKRLLVGAGAKRSPPKEGGGGGTFGAVVAGAIAGTTAAAAGANAEEALRAAETVMTGQVPPPSENTETAPDEIQIPGQDGATSVGGDDSGVTDQAEIDRRLREQARQRRIEREQQQREDAARRRVEILRSNERILSGDCSCIGIEADGEYVCLDGLVQGKNARGRLCDIRR